MRTVKNKKFKPEGVNSPKGFTLIELLVVIAIIALLLSITLPGLRKAKDAAKRVVCGAHSKQIVTGMLTYVGDSDERFFFAKNGFRWYDLGTGTADSGRMYDPYEKNAYWGTAYKDYVEVDSFKCSAKKKNHGWWNVAESSDLKAYDYSDYTINGYICWRDPATSVHKNKYVASDVKDLRRLHDFKNTSSIIAFHDGWEENIDHVHDAYYIDVDNGAVENLLQWKTLEMTTRQQYEGCVREYWRHDGFSNVTWLDGHVSILKETNGEDVPRRWYSGHMD